MVITINGKNHNVFNLDDCFEIISDEFSYDLAQAMNGFIKDIEDDFDAMESERDEAKADIDENREFWTLVCNDAKDEIEEAQKLLDKSRLDKRKLKATVDKAYKILNRNL